MRGEYAGTAIESVNFQDKEYECQWKVWGWYTPGRFYDHRGDPGPGPEGDEEVTLKIINGWNANKYLKRLEYWNKKAHKYLTTYDPDTSDLY